MTWEEFDEWIAKAIETREPQIVIEKHRTGEIEWEFMPDGTVYQIAGSIG